MYEYKIDSAMENSVNSSKRKYPYVYVLAAIVLSFFAVLLITTVEPDVDTTGDCLQISGSFGKSIPASEIKSVKLQKKLPVIYHRYNGFGIGNIKKGYYELSDKSKALLFLHSDDDAIEISTKDETVYINSSERAKTLNLYNEICRLTW